MQKAVDAADIMFHSVAQIAVTTSVVDVRKERPLDFHLPYGRSKGTAGHEQTFFSSFDKVHLVDKENLERLGSR